MDRRTFLSEAGGLLGLTLGGALAGCATHKGVSHGPGPVDTDAWLADLDRQERALRGLGLDPHAGRAARAAGLPADFVADALSQVLVLSAFRDLPAAAQAHPAAQRRAWRAAVRNGQLTLATARALGRLDEGALGWLRGSDALAPLTAGVLRGWAGTGVGRERRDQLIDGVDQLQWRLARQGPGLVFGEQRRRTERLGLSAGLAPVDWDGAIDLPVPIDRMSYPDSESPWKQLHTSERLAVIGATICGLGIGLTIGGIFVISRGVFYGVFGITYGILAIIGGFVVLMVAAGKGSRERANPAAYVTRGAG